MTAAAPGIIAAAMGNAYYDSHERYVFAVAKQMQKEVVRAKLRTLAEGAALASARLWG